MSGTTRTTRATRAARAVRHGDPGIGRPPIPGPPDGAGAKGRGYAPLAVASDALGVLVPVAGVYHLTDQGRPVLSAVVACSAWLVIRAGHLRYVRRVIGESRGLLAAAHDWALLVGVLALLRVLTGENSAIGAALAALLPALLLSALTGALIHHRLAARRRAAEAVRRVLVVGEADPVAGVTARLAARTDHPYVVVGTVPVGAGEPADGVPVTGRLTSGPVPERPSAPEGDPDDGVVTGAARRCGADLVLVVPGSRLTGDRLRRLSWQVQDAGLPLMISSGLGDVPPRRVRVSTAAGLQLIQVVAPTRGGPQLLVKHLVDRVGAALGLVLLAPLFAVIALLVRLDSRGPVLFRQLRIGRRGVPFVMWKFRSMVPDADRLRGTLEEVNEQSGPLFKMRRDPRVTRVGRLLRRSSLDELPQLWNVLRGEMSLVGPRPPLPEEVARYGPVEHRRLDVRPGLTGPWQVEGRSELSWEESLALDLSYTDNWSLTGDLDVLARTARAVAGGRGAY
ncbi:sugar transferase [Streptomyces sp. ST2-7A]|uniref:sugar transferase n=1 Tax=Streptomyces sp. ST2-7A TaxID=2907214 RepID=UPI001F2A14CA|nr:sugar transferase [Streptomyces sp. ST2-7A]MCE7081300.1 sugar transferase [Streptomyces sp. ST2-7A]